MKKNILIVLSLILVIGIIIGTTTIMKTKNVAELSSNTSTIVFKDALGKKVLLKNKPKKVVALSGSYGEIWTLAGGELVGITNDVIEENRFKVSNNIEIIGTIKHPNLEKIIELKPDFVILSSEIPSHSKIANSLNEMGITCAFFNVEKFSDYLHWLDIFTSITDRKDLYKENGLDIKQQIENNIAFAKEDGKQPKVLLLRAYSTGVKAKSTNSSIAGEILLDFNCVNIADNDKSLLEDLSVEEIIKQDPDYIFVVPMGSDTDKAVEGADKMICSNPALSSLTAIKNKHYYVLSKELFHYKPNNKWGEAYEQIRQIIYP